MYRISTIALLLTPTFALAHDGHGFFPADKLAHYFTAPEHAWIWMTAGLLGMAIVFRALLRKHKASLRPRDLDQ